MTAARRPAAVSGVVEELSAVLAADVVARLLERLGGRSLYVPKKPMGDGHPIAVAVGPAAAKIITQFLGGTTLDLPLPRDKAQRIRELAKTVRHRGHIASQVGCTERWVYKVLGAPAADAGPDLFS